MTEKNVSTSSPADQVTDRKSATSPEQLPGSWIGRIFERLEVIYGSKLADLWRSGNQQAVKAAWAEGLAGFTAQEIQRGLEKCLDHKFPPVLPEFRAFCRSAPNAEAAYHEACEQLPKRAERRDTWSHPAIYWAAQKIGLFDLRNSTWGNIQKRWGAVFGDEIAKGAWLPVPEFRVALPALGKTRTGKGEAKKRIEGLRAALRPSGAAQAVDRQ